LDVKVITVALLLVFVVGNLDFLSAKLRLVGALNAFLGTFLLLELDKAEAF
jgi:hypothetical protein